MGFPGEEVPSRFGEYVSCSALVHRVHRHHPQPALGVLGIGMESVSELKFVIPPLAKLLSRALERMSRND